MLRIFELHIAAEFVKQTLIVMAVLSMLVVLVQYSDQATDVGRSSASYFDALVIVLLRVPYLISELTFLSAFVGGLLALSRLTTSTEATALKALGYSGWRIIFVGGLASAALAFAAGPLASPFAAAAMRQAVAMESQAFGSVSTLSIFSIPPIVQWAQLDTRLDGKPFRISYRPGQVVAAENLMTDVRFDFFDKSKTGDATVQDQVFTHWIHAQSARVQGQSTQLSGVTVVRANNRPEQLDTLTLDISPQLSVYETGAPAPNTLSLLQLMLSQDELANAGIRAPIHVLRAQQLLSLPLLAFSAVLLSSVFATRSARHGRRGFWVTMGYVTGVNLFFLYNLTIALGTQSVQEARFTIWILPVFLTLVSIWLISFLEDN